MLVMRSCSEDAGSIAAERSNLLGQHVYHQRCNPDAQRFILALGRWNPTMRRR